jgi:hypothetical protein
MRKRRFIESIAFRLDSELRNKVEKIAYLEGKSLGEVGRELLEAGLVARAETSK